MLIPPFSLSRLPQVIFGPGSFDQVPSLVGEFGRRVLVVTGSHSLRRSVSWQHFIDALKGRKISREDIVVRDEPTPQLVDQAVRVFRHAGIEVVVGIGGGSVLDAAKAIAGLLGSGNSVFDYLEGVGPERPYTGPAVPFIAVPTTAGTGAEATRNAVLTLRGPQGFKKSFRAEALVARYAVVDPNLLRSCPQPLIAANCMDALTQLLESYVSARSHPVSDALALSGMEAVRDGLLPWYDNGVNADAGRSQMAYASLVSGITLAQVGLGSVHGLAAPLGAFFPIPHGVACGTLLAAATAVNIEALTVRAPEHPALKKYARAGRLLQSDPGLDEVAARAALLSHLEYLTAYLGLPRLRDCGLTEGDLDTVVAHSRGNSMKTNPVLLEDAEVRAILARRF